MVFCLSALPVFGDLADFAGAAASGVLAFGAFAGFAAATGAGVLAFGAFAVLAGVTGAGALLAFGAAAALDSFAFAAVFWAPLAGGTGGLAAGEAFSFGLIAGVVLAALEGTDFSSFFAAGADLETLAGDFLVGLVIPTRVKALHRLPPIGEILQGEGGKGRVIWGEQWSASSSCFGNIYQPRSAVSCC